MSSCELNLGDQYMYVCMYVYEDSNFGGFRIPHVYANAQKWFDHMTKKACFVYSSGLFSLLSPFSTRRICSRDAKRKQEFSNVIGWRKRSLLRQPITLPDSCFRFASREQIRLVENGLYVGLYCEICSLKLSLLREDFLLYQGKIIIICN